METYITQTFNIEGREKLRHCFYAAFISIWNQQLIRKKLRRKRKPKRGDFRTYLPLRIHDLYSLPPHKRKTIFFLLQMMQE